MRERQREEGVKEEDGGGEREGLERQRVREGRGASNYNTLPCAASPVDESTIKPIEHFEIKFLSLNV